MLADAYERCRGNRSAWEGNHGLVLPEVDPTDDFGADIRNVSQPERRLLFAILADAIVRFRRLATAPRHVSRELMEAERWIRSDDREWPCSFVNVCEALDISYGPLRRQMLRWRRQAGATSRRVTRRGLLVKDKKKTRQRSADTLPASATAAGETTSGAVSPAASAALKG
jgi:hypothetical protein